MVYHERGLQIWIVFCVNPFIQEVEVIVVAGISGICPVILLFTKGGVYEGCFVCVDPAVVDNASGLRTDYGQ